MLSIAIGIGFTLLMSIIGATWKLSSEHSATANITDNNKEDIVEMKRDIRDIYIELRRVTALIPTPRPTIASIKLEERMNGDNDV